MIRNLLTLTFTLIFSASYVSHNLAYAQEVTKDAQGPIDVEPDEGIWDLEGTGYENWGRKEWDNWFNKMEVVLGFRGDGDNKKTLPEWQNQIRTEDLDGGYKADDVNDKEILDKVVDAEKLAKKGDQKLRPEKTHDAPKVQGHKRPVKKLLRSENKT
jgi:hypothetical protein